MPPAPETKDHYGEPCISSEDDLYQQSDDDGDDEQHGPNARGVGRSEGSVIDQQPNQRHVPEAATTNARSTAYRPHASSSSNSRSSKPEQQGGAAAEYYNPAQSFRTEDTLSCCSSCTGTTSNDHPHGSTTTHLPVRPLHIPAEPPQPVPRLISIPDGPSSHNPKPGIFGTAKALRQLRSNNPTYHEDTWERVELLRRMDRTFNRGVIGKLTLFQKRKKNMFLQEAEAIAARLRSEQPAKITRKG
ncbi:hypothetical protein LTR86_007438 [Recurvomyces mirabilis]|nr:hypothetical protein LTR86_007438 [Recurvomyces mirabilis]